MDRAWLPVNKSYKLNERHYGALQGLNKKETAEKFGEDLMILGLLYLMKMILEIQQN